MLAAVGEGLEALPVFLSRARERDERIAQQEVSRTVAQREKYGHQCGIVGLPNVGKSTLFNALTRAQIAAENYPFCTIDPNVGVVPVPDPRLDALAGIVKPERILPATVEFVDIAGLVAGATKGEGLGNQFLSHIRETDAIAHVVRCFEDDDIVHVAGRVDPLATSRSSTPSWRSPISRRSSAACSAPRRPRRPATRMRSAARPAEEAARAPRRRQAGALAGQRCRGAAAVAGAASDHAQAGHVRRERRRGRLQEQSASRRVRQRAARRTPKSSRSARRSRRRSRSSTKPIARDFLQELGLDEPGLNRVIRAGYKLLGLQTYFTAGPKEVRAWTVRIGATAPQAAGVIHTDFEKGFIRAEVIAYDDYIAIKGEQGAKEAGKLRLEGKEYVVHEGDVMHFRFNV